MTVDAREAIGLSIADSGYIGWVVWIDDNPIFQSVPTNFKLIQPAAGAYYPETRHPGRNVLDWKELPHERISRLEVYGLHEFYTHQPLIRLDRPPGMAEQDVRFCCLTMGGLAVGTSGDQGQMRTGVAGWKVGWMNPVRREFDLWEITRTGRRRLNPAGGYLNGDGAPLKGHPCWPKPAGFGIGSFVFGLTDADVPQYVTPT